MKRKKSDKGEWKEREGAEKENKIKDKGTEIKYAVEVEKEGNEEAEKGNRNWVRKQNGKV